MGSSTKIEWTEQTWNPVRGCSPVSPGCKNCYAERTAGRFCKEGEPFHGFVQIGKNGDPGPHWTGKVELIPHMLDVPLRRRIPTTYFVNSMSDLFHENLPDESIDRVFAVMALCPQHTFQVLTKRAGRMREWATNRSRGESVRGAIPDRIQRNFPISWPLRNVHLGVSAEDQQCADERTPELLNTPAALRFLSMEPLLGPMDIWQYLGGGRNPIGPAYGGRGIDWVIVGGESGPGARPMHPDWARNIRDQCVAAVVPFFFKQWGEIAPWDCTEETRSKSFILLKDGTCGTLQDLDRDARPNFLHRPQIMARVGKKAAGRLLDGREWNEMPAGRSIANAR